MLIFGLLFANLLSIFAPTTTPSAATGTTYNCYCHDKGFKDWGK